jgi:hypothetical protein
MNTALEYLPSWTPVFNISLFDDEKDNSIGTIHRVWSGAYDAFCAKAS